MESKRKTSVWSAANSPVCVLLASSKWAAQMSLNWPVTLVLLPPLLPSVVQFEGAGVPGGLARPGGHLEGPSGLVCIIGAS